MANEEVADRYFESIKDRDFAPILKAELLKIGISTEVPIAGQGFQSLNDVKDVTFGMLFGLLALTFAASIGPSNWHNQLFMMSFAIFMQFFLKMKQSGNFGVFLLNPL